MWTSYKKLFNGINVNTIICIAYKSHYEVLKIPKTATHKEIKDAYYRLSMIYHPDKNKGCEESSNNFRDITSAYEVLGNVRQRKLYDSGQNPNKKSEQYNNKPFETMNSKESLYKAKASSIDYNFDEWSKAHYTNSFQQHYEAREKVSRNKVYNNFVEQQNNYNLMVIMTFATVFLLIGMFEIVTTKNHDKIKEVMKNDEN